MRAKVLIVEDEFLVALHLKMMLTARGFEIVGIAPDMNSARAFAAKNPDIALVDVNLRDGPTGPEIGEMLAREHGASVMFVTANPRQLYPVPEGPIGVMTKPLNDNEIGLVLDYMVQHRRGNATKTPHCVTLFPSGSDSKVGAQA
jgi:two-component system, response regulator PdtaR